MEQSLRFSGHETFVCKQFWLKKGFDFASRGLSFTDPSAVSELGVGKNMVSAINFWSKSFGIIDDSLNSTELGEFLLGDPGQDPYLEDIGSLWLLHYSLVKQSRASIYYLVYNEFIRERIEFTKKQLHGFLKRKCEEVSGSLYNERTINNDINVFLRNYQKPRSGFGKQEIEEVYTALLLDLEMLSVKVVENSELFTFEVGAKENLPIEVVLFSIIENYSESSISFQELLHGYNSPGQIFCLDRDGLYSKIELLTSKYSEITFTRTAGNEIMQINGHIDKWGVLHEYYN